jgi:serine O-acetyltransferase
MKAAQQANDSATPLPPHMLAHAAGRVLDSIFSDSRTRHIDGSPLPDRVEVLRLLGQIESILFPGFHGPRALTSESIRDRVMEVLDDVGRNLQEQVMRALRYERHMRDPRSSGATTDLGVRAEQVITGFLLALPEIRRLLSLDVQAAFDGDPAARHTDEAIFCYPGLRALSVHRVAHELYRLDVPLIPRMMAELAHSVTGIDIHPGARIGKSFFIDHGTGVVIGETTLIGDHCKVYQGVTLGAKSFPKDEGGQYMRGVKRHPTLEDFVVVYAGATILGGDTVIGAASVINGSVFVTGSIPPGHVVRGPKLDITLRSNPELPPGMYSI